MQQFVVNGTRIACYSAVDTSLNKSLDFQPLCRIYYNSIEDTVCIAQVLEGVNSTNEKIVGVPENACQVLFNYVTSIEAIQNINVVPNPTSGNLNVRFTLPTAEPFTLYVVNALGQAVYSETHQGSLIYNDDLNLDYLPVGTYTLRITGSSVNASRSIAVIR